MKIFSGTLIGLFILGIVASIVPAVSAATGQLYLSPSSGSVENGKTVGVAIRLNPGTKVDGVEAVLTFDSSKLQVIGVDSSSSPFNVQLNQSSSGGTVEIARGNLSGGVTSDALVATVTLKALTGSGTASLQLSGNATFGGSYTGPAVSGGSLSLTTPPSTGGGTTTPPPTGGGSGGSTNPGGSGSTNPGTKPPANGTGDKAAPPTNPKKEEGAPVVTATPESQFTSGTIELKSDKNATYTVKYGTSPKNLNLQVQVAASTSGEVKLDALAPGTRYYYQVVATADGKQSVSAVQSFKTKGYTLKATLVDRNLKPLANKKVTLHSDPITATTDAKGVATFKDVATGNHQLVYTQGGKDYKQLVQVEGEIITGADGNQIAATQQVSLVYDVKNAAFNFIAVIGFILLLILVAAAIYIIRTKNMLPFSGYSGATVPSFNTPYSGGVVVPPPASTDKSSHGPSVYDVPSRNSVVPGQVIGSTKHGNKEGGNGTSK